MAKEHKYFVNGNWETNTGLLGIFEGIYCGSPKAVEKVTPPESISTHYTVACLQKHQDGYGSSWEQSFFSVQKKVFQ